MVMALVMAMNPQIKTLAEWKDIKKPIKEFVKTQDPFIDLTVTFEAEGDEIHKNIPKVRVNFKN